MEIDEPDWLTLNARLHVLMVLAVGLVRIHDDREHLIDSFRKTGFAGHDLMLATPMTDAEIEAHRRAHAELLTRLTSD